MKKIISISTVGIFAILSAISPVEAISANSLLFNINASDPGSYSVSNPNVWTDLSSANQSGTVYGTVTKVGDALKFPGNTSSYVDMGPGYSNFGTGISIEFEANFGLAGNTWERIFDFGNAAGVDNIWVGSYANSSEVVVELWKPNPTTQTGMGRCRADDSVNSIVANTFKKYVVTLDGTTCRIYIDGTEINTVVDGPAKGTVGGQNSSYDAFYDAAGLGSAYPFLPSVTNRTRNFIGKSNWSADAAFDGSIKYVRIYSEAISSTDVNNNAQTYTLSYATTGSDSGSAPTSRTGNGLVSLDGNSGNLVKAGHTFVGWATTANQTTAISGSYNLTANSSLYPAFLPNTYTVTYNSEGGSTVSNGSFTHGGSLTFPTAPTRTGYTFAGWFSASSGGTALTASGVAAGNSSVTLHAQWVAASSGSNTSGATASTDSTKLLANTGILAAPKLITSIILIFLGVLLIGYLRINKKYFEI